MSKKRIGVILAGCGVFDGAEIHEATLTLYFLDRAGAEVITMAPNKDQHHVINHLSQEESGETRNVLVESARIARGNIIDLADAQINDLDGVILPGGFGAAKNLSTVAFDGPEAQVDEQLKQLLLDLHKAGKPIGAICISPAVVSKVFSDQGVTLTIGDDQGTAEAIKTMGNRHENSAVDGIVIDKKNKIASTGAYMCQASIAQVGEGIEKLVEAILEMS
ncbi:isoprenoid biosynthesis glyoxalase ElbB [Magnetococcales bacterium HHB-1]